MGLPPTRTEADDVRLIVRYLGIRPSSWECQIITGLSKSSISDLLNGKRSRGTRRQRHIAIAAEVVERLAAARIAATGTDSRVPSTRWLRSAQVATSRGTRTPLEVLGDSELASEVLEGLRR